MNKIARLFFGFWCIMFLLFAYVQWNDPDPELWMSLYGFAGLMCALAFFNRFFVPLLIFGTIACFLGGVYFFPSSVINWVMQEWQQADLSMKTMEMEEARESFGLFLVSLILGLAAYKGWRKISSGREKGIRRKFSGMFLNNHLAGWIFLPQFLPVSLIYVPTMLSFVSLLQADS